MNILGFEQFINEMYLSDKYKERIKVYPGEARRSDSKSAVESKLVSPEGWAELLIMDENGKIINSYGRDKVSTSDILGGMLFDKKSMLKDIPKILSKAMNYLGSSEIIKNFEPDNKEYKYYLVDLGIMEMVQKHLTYYPVFVKGGDTSRKYEGRNFYAVAATRLNEPILYSFFYSASPNEISQKYLYDQAMWHLNKAASEGKTDYKPIRSEEFMQSCLMVHPYGKDFVLKIDLNKESVEAVEKDILSQLKMNEPVKDEPKEKTDGIPMEARGQSHLSITPGKTIGLIIPYISAEEFTIVTIKEILNIKKIQDALKFKSGLRDIDSIDISWVKEGDEKGVPGRSTIKRGTVFQTRFKKKYVKCKVSEDKSFITPNANVISEGSVPIKITRY
jgi:hypothetical protein